MLSLVLSLALVQAPQAPRDARPAREGTGSISGVVTAADSGLPLRRAQVMLTGAPPMPREGAAGTMNPNRSVLTDADGRYQFTGLPAGTYRLRAMPGSFRGQYLAVAYGTTRQFDPGKPIELKDGQRVDQANVALPRGGAINGRVIDEFGEPVTRVSVYAARAMAGGASFARMGGGFNQTDDLGRFRVYGLEAGEYIVAAESRGMGMGGPPIEGETEGFATTYYPSALSEREGSRVRVTSGSDSGEIQIQLVRTRTFRITGMVMDSKGQLVTRPNAMLARRTAGSGMASSGVSFDQAGKFTIRDVVPGEYRLIVRPTGGRGGPPPPPGAPPPAQGERPEYASVPLSVSADIDDLVVITKPGLSITGEVTFAEAPPPTPVSGLRITTMPPDRVMMMGPSPNTTVGADMQFTLTETFGSLFVNVAGLPKGYAIEQVMLGSTDITDTAVEFTPQHNKQLRIVLTTRVATLEGTVTDDNDKPVNEATLLVIPEEKASWRLGSPRLRTIGGLKEGKYSQSGFLPGRYYVIALPREAGMLTPDMGAEYFEQLTKDATAVVLNDGETRTVDLRLARSPDR